MNPTQLNLYESGDAKLPAILFLHGSPMSGRMWQPQLAALQNDFHCLAPDLPEHGLSAGVKPFEMQSTVRMLAELIQSQCPAGKAHVVGLSFGGVVAQAMMTQAPQVVDHVLLSGTSARMSGALLSVMKVYIALNRPVMKYLPPRWITGLLKWQFGIPDIYEKMLVEDLYRVGMDAMMRFILETYASIETPSSFPSPVLVTIGGKETPAARSMAGKLHKTIQGSQGVRVPGATHVWNLQKADLFNEVLRSWLCDRPLPAGLLPL